MIENFFDEWKLQGNAQAKPEDSSNELSQDNSQDLFCFNFILFNIASILLIQCT